jgi:hypothetical protein
MSKTYELVNPFILGTFNRKFNADNSLQAAHMAYQSLSQYFTGHMPRFKFSLQRVKKSYMTGGGKEDDYLHFETFEKKLENKGIEYAIKPIKSEVNIDNFQQKLQNFLKRKKVSSLISSEESDDENNIKLKQKGGDLADTLTGGKKYVVDEELDPELEKLLYEDDDDFGKKKKKTKKGWTALNGPLVGQIVQPSPISYYRYDPVLYTEYINYVPVFTESGRPKRMVYDIYFYSSLKQ